MTKKIIQDIVIKKKELKPPVIEKKEEKKRGRGGRAIKWISTILIITVLIIGFLSLINGISSAEIKITPKQQFADVDWQMQAGRNSNSGGLNFEIIQLEKEDSYVCMATGSKDDGQKAKGRIIIYNQYSSKPQKLVAQTRFETPDGKIYRIQEAISVPGLGSVEAMVYADQVGPEYNIGLSDFTLPGFKGAPQYEKIYGRSATVMTRGALGKTRVVAESDINDAKNKLEEKIKNSLMDSASKQKPENYILYKNALQVNFIEDKDNPREGDSADQSTGEFTFKETGQATGFLFKQDDLSKVLADKYLSEDHANTGVINLDNLEFNLLNNNADNTAITFTLKGRAHFIWNIDQDNLLKDLINQGNKDYQSVFAKYPDIEKAEIFFKPAWWQSLPKNQNRIHIETIILNE